MMQKICNKSFDEERALYNLRHAHLFECVFEGPADGESALKEAKDIEVNNCTFRLRYPLWHVERFKVLDSTLDEPSRASLWYASDGEILNSEIKSVKAIRECKNIKMDNCNVVSAEFGWKSDGITVSGGSLVAEYAFLDSKNLVVKNLDFKGKYSFQYVENLVIEDSYLDTKDAFWHSKNVTVKNSVVKGEYLAWFSEGLTLINCKIIGTQPFCYCENLKLIDCQTEGADLAFEYSSVNATVNGAIVSVKNPKSGVIVADEIGEIIHDHSIMESTCKITVRGEK